MNRPIVIAMLVGIAFVMTVVISMALTGNLNSQAFKRLLGREDTTGAVVEQTDPSGPFAQALREKERAINEREKELDERDQRLAQRQRILDDTLTEVTQIQEEIQIALDELDTDRDERIEKSAKLLAAMTAVNAAKDIEAMPPEDAAEIIRRIKERNAGRILDAMEPQKRTLVHQHLQERKY